MRERPPPQAPVVGALLAGGASRRFGSSKAHAVLAGRPLAAHAAAPLRATVGCVALLSEDGPLAALLGLERVADDPRGAGPLGGLLGALDWAVRRGAGAVLALSCDLPLVPASLLRELCEAWRRRPAIPVLAPAGPTGPEPLCAIYAVHAAPALAECAAAGTWELRRVLEAVGAEPFPAEAVSRHGDPRAIFLNVNTPAELDHAERLLAGRAP
jgi:molybdopterin-guanine dinucleotide biosynthesis protein A